MEIHIRLMTAADWEEVATIYGQGIATGNATFEQEVPDWETWDKGHLQVCRLVAVSGAALMGWASLSAVSARKVYAGVAEVSVYVGAQYRGQKTGSLLLSALIEASETAGFWTLQAGIFPENTVSLEMHRKAGFRELGYREKIGMMKGLWRDTILLERRSTITGME